MIGQDSKPCNETVQKTPFFFFVRGRKKVYQEFVLNNIGHMHAIPGRGELHVLADNQ